MKTRDHHEFFERWKHRAVLARNLLQLTPVNFSFKWRHRDGSIVEFSATGWSSDDPRKAGWLAKMNQLSSADPAISPGVRLWLQEECELVAFSGPDDQGKER